MNDNIPIDLINGIRRDWPVEQLIGLTPEGSLGEKYGLIARLKSEMASAKDLAPEMSTGPHYMTRQPEIIKDLPVYSNLLPMASMTPECVEDMSKIKGKQVTVVISDLHIPRHRQDLLLYVAKKYEGARVIIAGDVMNNDRYSEWPKLTRLACRYPEHLLNAQQCLEMSVDSIAQIAPYFSDVKILRGNHDDWAAKAHAKMTGGDTSRMDKQFEDAFEAIPNVTVPKTTIRDFYMVKRGDAWIGHWLAYGRLSNKGANNAVDWMLNNIEIEQMGDWKVLVQAHTHRVSSAIYKRKWAMECGSFTTSPDYIDVKPGKGLGNVPELGFVVLTQYDGQTCRMESGTQFFDDCYYSYYMDIGGYKGKIHEHFV